MNVMLAVDLSADDAEPLRRLMCLGKPDSHEPTRWLDYHETCNIGPEHIGALIRIACDTELYTNASESEPGLLWAPVHAWRALGQLRAEQATEPLLALSKALDDEMVALDLPVVFGMIGPPATPALFAFLSDRANTDDSSATAIGGLTNIATRHPECRNAVVAALIEMLAPHPDQDPTIGGFVVSALIDLHATEAIDAIRDAFAGNAVEIAFAGDLEDVEIALGLRSHRVTPRPRYISTDLDWSFRSGSGETEHAIQMPVRSEKIGRNEPCPCGSGKKYKKCCLP